jgi:hypothetical protein|uniref:Uncharacterized protein n=1 Tax=Podoviridae sp. ctz6O13 TaxID=2827757 RepID=A0A8S5TKL2_9CAUD|nr:MAG TPA: hypothetical protein [Podoviridae sp. ctz6O13]
MAIEKTFLHFKTKSAFEKKRDAGEIGVQSIVFVKEGGLIWTHGRYYSLTDNTLTFQTGTNMDVMKGDNIDIKAGPGGVGVIISAKDTTYTLRINHGFLRLYNQDNMVVSSVELPTDVPEATSTKVGGVKIDTTPGEETVTVDNKDMQLVPSGGTAGQVLTHDGTKAVWQTPTGTTPPPPQPPATPNWYGVKWTDGQKDPHLERTGDLQKHKTLPIQNGMYGCVYNAVDKTEKYKLNPTDWGRRINPTTVGNVTFLSTGKAGEYRLTPMDTADIREGQRIYHIQTGHGTYYGTVSTVTGNVVTVTGWTGPTITNGTKLTVELGSVLTGQDGEVMVYVPGFYIYSTNEGNEHEVKISDRKEGSNWHYQNPFYVSAYKVMEKKANSPSYTGYLNRIAPGSLVSAIDPAGNFKGGSGEALPPKTLNAAFYSLNGKCRTNLTRVEARTAAQLGQKELLSYKHYKNLYWLYVIEYANFFTQEAFSAVPNPSGYHHGGLGKGISGFTQSAAFNNSNPVCYNGYTNDIGNLSGVKKIELVPDGAFTGANLYANRWRGIENPFGDTFTNVDGVVMQRYSGATKYKVYMIEEAGNYRDDVGVLNENGEFPANFTSSFVKEWALIEKAVLVPQEVVSAPASEYRCAKIEVAVHNDLVRTACFGGAAGTIDGAGMGSISYAYTPSQKANNIGYRTVVDLS